MHMYLLLLLLPGVVCSQKTRIKSLEQQVSDLMGDISLLSSEISLLRGNTKTALALSNSTSIRQSSEISLQSSEISLLRSEISLLRSKTWTLKRTMIIFPNLEKLMPHRVTPTYVEEIPGPLPDNTRAVIVSVYCYYGTSDGYANLNVDISQEGNKEGGVANVENYHYKVYGNSFYYEVFVPWDSTISNELRFEVKSSYHPDGGYKWCRLRVVGYVLA